MSCYGGEMDRELRRWEEEGGEGEAIERVGSVGVVVMVLVEIRGSWKRVKRGIVRLWDRVVEVVDVSSRARCSDLGRLTSVFSRQSPGASSPHTKPTSPRKTIPNSTLVKNPTTTCAR